MVRLETPKEIVLELEGVGGITLEIVRFNAYNYQLREVTINAETGETERIGKGYHASIHGAVRQIARLPDIALDVQTYNSIDDLTNAYREISRSVERLLKEVKNDKL